MKIKGIFSKKETIDENDTWIQEDAAQRTYLRLLNEFRCMELWLKIIPRDLTQIRRMFERADLEAFGIAPFDTISYRTTFNLINDTIRCRQNVLKDYSANEFHEYCETSKMLGPICSIFLKEELGIDSIFESVIDMSLQGRGTPCHYYTASLNTLSNGFVIIDGLNFKPLYQIEYLHEFIQAVFCLLTAINTEKLSYEEHHKFQIWWTFFDDVDQEYKKYIKWCGIVNRELLRNPHYRWESVFIIDEFWEYSSGDYETYLNNVFNCIAELDITKERAYELCVQRTREFLTNASKINRKDRKMNLF